MKVSRFIFCCFPLVFMVCGAGCQSISTHSTVKHALPEVTNAVLLSFHNDLRYAATKTLNVRYVATRTNDIPGTSYTLTLGGGAWPIDMRRITICATTVNSNETSIAVRCDSTSGDVVGYINTRRIPSVERHMLASVIKTLNKTPDAKMAN